MLAYHLHSETWTFAMRNIEEIKSKHHLLREDIKTWAQLNDR